MLLQGLLLLPQNNNTVMIIMILLLPLLLQTLLQLLNFNDYDCIHLLIRPTKQKIHKTQEKTNKQTKHTYIKENKIERKQQQNLIKLKRGNRPIRLKITLALEKTFFPCQKNYHYLYLFGNHCLHMHPEAPTARKVKSAGAVMHFKVSLEVVHSLQRFLWL